MNKFTLLLSSLFVAHLTACGGGSSGGDSLASDAPSISNADTSNNESNDDVEIQQLTINESSSERVQTVVQGVAAKGIIANASVAVYKLVDGQFVEVDDNELVDGRVSTNSSGRYDFTLLNYTGPLKTEITVNNDAETPTLMQCDAPNGCNGVAFGDWVNLFETAPNFSLSSIAFVEQGVPTKINITPLTHFASALIEREANFDIETITEQYDLISTSFGIDGNILELDPVNIFDSASLNDDVNENALRYALINAGIADNLYIHNDTESTLTERLQFAVIDIQENAGALLVSSFNDDTFQLTLESILFGASDAAAELADLISETENTDVLLSNILQLETSFIAERFFKEQAANDDGRFELIIDAPVTGENQLKAESMVNDIRLFANLLDVTTLPGREINGEAEAYLTLIEDSSVLVTRELTSFDLLADSINVVADLAEDYLNGQELQSTYTAQALFNDDTTTGFIRFNRDERVFTVALSNSEGDLSLSLQLESQTGNTLVLSSTGEIVSPTATFNLLIDSQIVVSYDGVIDDLIDDVATTPDTLTALAANLDLSVIVQQNVSEQITDPLRFEGRLVAELSSASQQTEHFIEQAVNNQTDVNLTGFGSLLLAPDMLTFSGAFSSLSGNELSTVLTLNLENLDEVVTEDGLSIRELENNYLEMNAVLSVSLKLAGYDVSMTLVGNRTGLNQGEFDLNVVYSLPGDNKQRALTINFDDVDLDDLEDGVFSISNSDGVSLNMYTTNKITKVDGDRVLGEFVVESDDENEVVAYIVKRGSIIFIKYLDGTIETI